MRKISVLIPTRGRYQHLQKAIDTLVDNASMLDEIEFLIRTDDDQPPACDHIKLPRAHVREFRGPRWGYGRMFDYYNELARNAFGKLLFVWNDDTEMLTPDWDKLLFEGYKETEPKVQFIRRDTSPNADDTFPIVDRKIFEFIGSLSKHCYVDTWLSHVSSDAGVRVFRNDIVFHHHRLTDETQNDNARELTGELHQNFGGMLAERQIESEKIKELLRKLGGTP